MEYQHKQWGFFLIPTSLTLWVLVISITSVDDPTSTLFTVAMVGFMVVLFIVVLVFSRLDAPVSSERVVAAFSFGRPHRVVEFADVTAVRRVRNRWWDGWGIRKISRGWMYNVSGLDAIELELASGKVFRIGTDDPEGPVAALTHHAPGAR